LLFLALVLAVGGLCAAANLIIRQIAGDQMIRDIAYGLFIGSGIGFFLSIPPARSQEANASKEDKK